MTAPSRVRAVELHEFGLDPDEIARILRVRRYDVARYLSRLENARGNPVCYKKRRREYL